MSAPDYCELCELPRSTCVHGQPPPVAQPVVPRAAPRPATRKAAPSAPVRSAPRKWTPPDAFTAEILAVLREAGGQLDSDELFLELESRMEDRLTVADQGKTPEGELRWQYAARRARQTLIADGLMTKGQPGLWALSPAGR